ncbi:hypothetical protein EMCRGX_G004283 [Ephydatia muelleri]
MRLLSIQLARHFSYIGAFYWSSHCDHAHGVCKCVASDYPSVGAMTVTKPTLCANVRVFRLEVWLLTALLL